MKTRVAAVLVASRAAIFAIIFLSAQAAVVKSSFGGRVVETTIRLHAPSEESLTRLFIVGDAEWFRSIADAGYAPGPFEASTQRNWAFFPLWPLLLRAVRFAGHPAMVALLIANALFGAGLLIFHRLSAESLDDDGVERAVIYLAFFPASYFFSLPVSESLFLLLSCAAFWCGHRRRWWPASALAALAGATRVTGILLVPALFFLHREREGVWFSRRLVSLVVAPAGLVAFMVFLDRRTGNALAFADLQRVWQREPSNLLSPVISAIRDWPLISVEWNFTLLNLLVAAGLLVATGYFVAVRRYAYATLVGGTVLMAMASGSLQSMARYALSAWPAFYVLARVIRHKLGTQLTIAVSGALLGVFCCLFALGIDIALS